MISTQAEACLEIVTILRTTAVNLKTFISDFCGCYSRCASSDAHQKVVSVSGRRIVRKNSNHRGEEKTVPKGVGSHNGAVNRGRRFSQGDRGHVKNFLLYSAMEMLKAIVSVEV